MRSLHGGSKAARHALHEKLGFPPDALPNLGSWKADAGFLSLLAEYILKSRPGCIVELGMGASTLVAARAQQMTGGGRLVSYDQHEEYVEAVRQWLDEHGLEGELHHAPLTRRSHDWPGRWYACAEVPDEIDLLVIDGPPWAVHPFGRGAADALFSRVAPGGVVMMDDGARPGERAIARRWKKRWPDFEFDLVHAGSKGTLIGRRKQEAD
ncbi:MAG: class I SAM-dependent methyltransferase [Oricola sp.]|nr:class I SAM-dependent methyltransferase [Oricola sp.]